MRPSRILAGVAVVGGLGFGFAGGEYSTLDLWTLQRSVATEHAAAAGLESEIDSLTREAEALESDPMAQERAARQRFGMLRPGETMYRIQKVPQQDR